MDHREDFYKLDGAIGFHFRFHCGISGDEPMYAKEDSVQRAPNDEGPVGAVPDSAEHHREK